MEINKIKLGDETLIDLTQDTVTPETLASGVTAHAANGEVITGNAYKNTYYVKGTQIASTGAWKGELPEVDALYDGLTIDYWLPFAGSGNATLELTLKDGTTTGPVNCYSSGTSRLTTHIAANNVCRLIYQTVTISNVEYTGWWLLKAYDANTTDITNLYNGSAAYFADSTVYRYQLLFQTGENTLTPLNNVNNNTGTAKAMLTNVEFDPFGYIFYYNSTTIVAVNNIMATSLYYHRNMLDIRYTLNCGSTLTAYKNVYLKVIPQENGMVKLATDPCWAQDLPTTNDGFWYIFLGRTYNTYQMALYTEHPVYYHDGTCLREKYNIQTATTTSDGLMSSTDKSKLDGLNSSGIYNTLQFTTTNGEGYYWDNNQLVIDRTEMKFIPIGIVNNNGTTLAATFTITDDNDTPSNKIIYNTDEPFPGILYYTMAASRGTISIGTVSVSTGAGVTNAGTVQDAVLNFELPNINQWGSIGGDLANQTDLQNALADKADSTDLSSKVSKSGDTMTGPLVLDNTGIDVQISHIDEDITPEASVYSQPIEVYDKYGELIGHIEIAQTTSNELRWQIGFYRTINGTKTWKQFVFGVDASGNLINNLITYGTAAKTSGTSELAAGTFYFQYE